MSASRSKASISGFLLISLLCCVLGTVAFAWNQKTNACFNNMPPLRSFVVTVGSYQERWVIKPSQEFADKNGFKVEISYYDQHGRDFSIWMKRKDTEVVVSNDIIDSDKFDVAFYNNDCLHPTVASDIVDLEDDLKSLIINEIPNAMITEVQKSLRITFDDSYREELLTQIQNLADKHSLQFTLSFSSDKTVFHSEIDGEGFHVIIDPVPDISSSGEILITFFIDYYKVPAPTSLDALDKLFNELKSVLSKNPDVTITEEK
jgi:hypothetical protein